MPQARNEAGFLAADAAGRNGVENRITWILEQLKKDFDFTTAETYRADRAKSEWPMNAFSESQRGGQVHFLKGRLGDFQPFRRFMVYALARPASPSM